MENRTYKYFKGEPLYPFGYGLSYTTFKYSSLKVRKTMATGDMAEVSVRIKNTGQTEGDEVIQVYITSLDSPFPAPIRSLRAFKRIHLLPGEFKNVKFLLPSDSFSVVNDEGEKVVLPGRFVLTVGGLQPQMTGDVKEKGILKAGIILK
jgi:beta-glucosidase